MSTRVNGDINCENCDSVIFPNNGTDTPCCDYIEIGGTNLCRLDFCSLSCAAEYLPEFLNKLNRRRGE